MRGRPPARRLFRLGLGRPRPRDAVDWEIEHHLAELADRLVDQGWVPEAAAREAERRFGGVKAYRRRLGTIERRRERMARWTGWTLALREALAGSVRTLRRQPGLSAAVVLTLGVGVGANAAMFSILDRLFFQSPAHVVEPDGVRRVLLESTFMGRRDLGATTTHADYQDLEGVDGVAAVAAVHDLTLTRGTGPDASRVRAVVASHTLFPLLGVHAERGRFFGPDDDRRDAPAVAVVSHEYWRRALGGEPDVLGTTLELAGASYAVVGVAPPGFTGPDLAPVDVWIPLMTGGVLAQGSDAWVGSRGWYWLHVVARLEPGASREAVEAAATAAHLNARREAVEEGRYAADARVFLEPLVLARGRKAPAEARVAGWLGGVSLLLLAIVCANVANLLLARGTRRRREVAVRLALGVSRSRLLVRAVAETALLGLLGSAVALTVASWGGGAVRRLLLPGVFFPHALGARLVAFTLALALAAGAVAGVAPALQAMRLDLSRDLGQGARGSGRRSRARSALTVGQAALSVLLLVGAGLFVRSVSRVGAVDLGLDVDRLVMGRIEFTSGLALGAFQDDPARTVEENRVYRVALEAVARVPGVASVAGTGAPLGMSMSTDLTVPGWDSLPRLPGGGPYVWDVTGGYFEVAGLALLQGRPIAESDGPGAEPVAVVSRTMARTIWGAGDALGACLHVREEEACTRVVGVVEDASRGDLEEPAYMAYYLPAFQRRSGAVRALYARAEDGVAAEALVGPVSAALRSADPTVRFAEVQTLRDRIDPQARSWRLGAALFSVFGALALLVAGIGLYGLLAFHVAESRRELGIRAALGAARTRLMGKVVRDGLRLTALGVGLGLALALALGRFAAPLLFRTSPSDPLVLGTVALTLVAVGLLASALPGLRATRVDPMDALRAD